MISLQARADGVVLPLRVFAGARQNGITGAHDGRLKVAVTTAPEKGKANKAVLRILADALGIKPQQLELLQGQTSPLKTVLVCGISERDLAERLQTRLNA